MVSKRIGCDSHAMGMHRGYFIPKQRFRSEAAEDWIVDKRKCTGPCENLVEV